MSHRPDLGYFAEGHDLASPAFYADAVRPAGHASTLPPAAFRSLAFTRLEDEAIWTRDWICVGSHDDIPNVGDLLPFTMGTHGVHVQRTEVGLAARFNKAQHGGCRMVPLQCQTGTQTRCSFTSCGHSRDRAAIPASELGDGTPEMHQYLGLRPERLLTAQVRSWGPLIFVNLDMDATVPDAMLGTIGRPNGLFGNHKATRGRERWMEFSANWKLVGQHLAVGTTIDRDADERWTLADTTLADGTPAKAAWVFPNLVLIATPTETCVVILQQTAIGQTLCRVSVYGETAVDAGVWHAEVEARAAHAVSEHAALARWGTSSRPETIGTSLPLQTHPQGYWLQQALAARVRRMPRAIIDTPLFQNPRL
ncbi:MAG TPA: ring-hydroxylating oxygenase subunit alpha [Ancylobacter sp.]